MVKVPKTAAAKLMLEPSGKKGVKIPYQYYVTLSEFILDALAVEEEVPLDVLLGRVNENFGEHMGSAVGWYFLKVKQDLEARKVIKKTFRVDDKRIQLITISKHGLKRYRKKT